ncbi:hypothetical protein [Sphaerospermopsis sp. FACHB-1194]|uniref:hypothetical protein n=1 Tax=Sphaerospermopsis sp. FACHB-1194 TaxID=2692862 RepID=UPI001680D60A|nr:hypothetical protein [Sphaerospermopsis sp. FACHB-1194]MBD2145493.1 hypothetical protein [Sphaerospermopsis sp. FACHB-1194]
MIIYFRSQESGVKSQESGVQGVRSSRSQNKNICLLFSLHSIYKLIIKNYE